MCAFLVLARLNKVATIRCLLLRSRFPFAFAFPFCFCQRYFGGGTIAGAVADGFHRTLRPIAGSGGESISAHFEDGSLPFLSILAVSRGIQTVQDARVGGMGGISAHTAALALYTKRRLESMRHFGTRKRVAVVYGWEEETSKEGSKEGGGGVVGGSADAPKHGSIVAFNLLRRDGSCVGHGEVGRVR